MQATHKICRACGRAFRGVEIFCPEDGSRLNVASRAESRMSDPLVGSILDGRYRVRRILGEGGMGIVYEAEHELIERKVALKVLREDFSRRADVVERFRREAKSASRIGHPNIVDVLDFGQTPDGASYFVMELLQGEDLADMLARDVRISPSRAVSIAVQCCRALAAAHEKGIVHRDLKPENVFIVDRGGFPDFVKLVDFGVAKMTELDVPEGGMRRLTRTGMIFGTPEYMSPEQANGQTLDHRVDVYALGVILYEMLTGRVPFEGESFMAVLSKHAAAPVPPLRETWPGLHVSAELDAVVMRALTKPRDQRFPHMRAFCDALEAVPEMPEMMPRDSLVPVRASATSSPGTHSSPGTQSNPLADSSVAPAVLSVDESRDTQATGWTKQRAILIGATAGAVLLAVIALTLRVTRSETESRAPAAQAPPAVAPPTPAPAPPAPPAKIEDVPPTAAVVVPAAPELVTLRLSTRPTGARLQLEGGGQVCSRTPCAFEVVRGKPISILARRGLQRAVTTLEPAADADVHIVLEYPKPGASKTAATPVRKGKRESTQASDLKVPDAFK